jgi:signal transduction histidine kinase/ActR/RegA family two-component response regulator
MVMTPPPVHPGSPPADDALGSLRSRVLQRTLLTLALTVPAVAVLIAVQSRRHGDLTATGIVLCLYTLVFPLLWLANRRLGFHSSAIALLGLLVLTASIIASRGGVAVGSVALSVLTLLLAALFFGRRGALVALAAVVTGFVAAGALILSEVVPPIQPAMWDPAAPRFWVRETVALALMGVAIVVAQVYVVERLVRQADDARGLAAREHEQRLALERAEREREHERAQRMLAQHALEESRRIEALARLAGGIAHDFNNALTVVLAAADLARSSAALPQEAEQYVNEITQAAQGASDLTRQLLMLGRQQIALPRTVRTAETLRRMRAAFERVLPTDITLDVEIPSAELAAYVDPVDLERAVFNLVLNARDAMPPGGTLTLRCREWSAGEPDGVLAAGDYTALDVSDTGTGMDETTRERIFEPFFTTKGAGAGTGLGLASVHGFARGSGGDVRVVSAPGQGTTFTLLLPRPVDSVPAAPQTPPTTAIAHDGKATGHILVVEDRADVRASMAAALTRQGFTVSEASNGDSALALLTGGEFALLCIDGVIPGASTAAVIEFAEDLHPEMPVLLCSGYVAEELLRRGIATGRYPFLAKPFSAHQLVESVRGALSRRAALHGAERLTSHSARR